MAVKGFWSGEKIKNNLDDISKLNTWNNTCFWSKGNDSSCTSVPLSTAMPICFTSTILMCKQSSSFVLHYFSSSSFIFFNFNGPTSSFYFWVPVVFAPVFRPSDPVGLALRSGVYVMPATCYNNTVIGVIFMFQWNSYDIGDVYLRYSTKQEALISIPDSYQSNESMCGSHRLKNG